MNEFIEQFLIEARELVEQATDDLLALEEKPGDRERLDSAFRAFHTLKGAAGIVDFHAMGRALHAAEDVLAGVRAGSDSVTPALVGDCLTCLDDVLQWLDEMQESGEPPAGADATADMIVQRFTRHLTRHRGGTEAPPPPPPSPREPAPWLPGLLARHPEVAARATLALRYTPDADCFFRGEDPLAVLADVPGLLALEIAPKGAWPDLGDLDPFTCHLDFLALLSGNREEVAVLLGPVRDQIDLAPLHPVPTDGSGSQDLPLAARELLEAQILLLAEGGGDGVAGRIGSAGRVAANVLRHAGRDERARAIEEALVRRQEARDPRPLTAAIRDALRGGAPEALPEPLRPASPAFHEPATRTLRVDVDRIDELVRLTGELTVVKNAIGHASALAQDGADAQAIAAALRDQHGLLNRLVGELQRSVLGIRVLPMRHVFQRFPRLVREISASVHKPVRLVVEGEETEADKAIVEAVFEPLLHAVRNAVDHGIEPGDRRAALGKPETGTLRLRAARAGDHVLIEVEDDGGGIDVARIRLVAAERRVASPEALAAMTDDAVIDLIFAPGFSTATEITGISGRGVGMDAVRAAVQRLGGRVTVQSEPGRGTVVRFTLPFEVMVTRVMTVEAGGQAFGIPLDSVTETVRVARDRIMPVGAARAFVLRNRTVPVVNLAEALGRPGSKSGPADATIVVVRVGGQLGGIEVDRLGERMDIMLKPVEGLLGGLRGLSGTTLLGDGRVLIVLDLQEILL